MHDNKNALYGMIIFVVSSFMITNGYIIYALIKMSYTAPVSRYTVEILSPIININPENCSREFLEDDNEQDIKFEEVNVK